MATAMDEDLEEELDEKDEKSMMCPPGKIGRAHV